MGLASMAVRPDRQRQGIGSELVRGGLDRLQDRSCPFVIVLGHPEYYPVVTGCWFKSLDSAQVAPIIIDN